MRGEDIDAGILVDLSLMERRSVLAKSFRNYLTLFPILWDFYQSFWLSITLH